jgi:hypothetical protein
MMVMIKIIVTIMMVIDFIQSFPVDVRSTAGIAGSYSEKNMDMRLLCFLCVAISVTSWSLVQGSPTDCVCLILRDLETSTTRQPRPELVGCATEKEKKILYPFSEVLDSFQETATGKHDIEWYVVTK